MLQAVAATVRASWAAVATVGKAEVGTDRAVWVETVEVGVRAVAAYAEVFWVGAPEHGIQRTPDTCSGSSSPRGCLGTN